MGIDRRAQDWLECPAMQKNKNQSNNCCQNAFFAAHQLPLRRNHLETRRFFRSRFVSIAPMLASNSACPDAILFGWCVLVHHHVWYGRSRSDIKFIHFWHVPNRQRPHPHGTLWLEVLTIPFECDTSAYTTPWMGKNLGTDLLENNVTTIAFHQWWIWWGSVFLTR